MQPTAQRRHSPNAQPTRGHARACAARGRWRSARPSKTSACLRPPRPPRHYGGTNESLTHRYVVVMLVMMDLAPMLLPPPYPGPPYPTQPHSNPTTESRQEVPTRGRWAGRDGGRRAVLAVVGPHRVLLVGDGVGRAGRREARGRRRAPPSGVVRLFKRPVPGRAQGHGRARAGGPGRPRHFPAHRPLPHLLWVLVERAGMWGRERKREEVVVVCCLWHGYVLTRTPTSFTRCRRRLTSTWGTYSQGEGGGCVSLCARAKQSSHFSSFRHMTGWAPCGPAWPRSLASTRR